MRLVSGSSSRARRRVLGLGAVVTVGLVVGGCTAEEPVEPEPSTNTAESPEVTEEPEPTPTETGPVKPERPAAMEQEDAEGAAAAAEYFIELYDYVMTTGDTTEWRAMSLESCTFCQGSIEQANQISSRSDVFEGGDAVVTVDDPTFYARDEATGIYSLDARVIQEPIAIRSAKGEELFAQERTDDLYRAEVGRRNGEWVVVEISLLEAS
ncbi:DUF6318 family protein [Cellulosimicrobium sp. PMB13]|uniref:DUF6318 family protein n=1 Tax=Cellulosimicrobium sp. PMB13 TaxID=3120158 RepID=UPI003F4B35FE